ncbi:MAG: arylesterase [Chitinophagaceae bacterium]
MNKLISFFLCIVSLTVISACGERAGSPVNTTQEAAAKKSSADSQQEKMIVFFGNSLTAGYGLEPAEAFPALIQQKVDSLDLPYKIINAGLSGETSAGGRSRIDWLLRQKIDVFILELGGNDGLRGIPVTETAGNLQAIIDKVRAKYPESKLVLAGMEVPPNMGSRYTGEFRAIFRQLAEKNNMAFLPFLLEGVGGVQDLNQNDGIHPTAEGHQIVANNVWEILRPIL